MVSRSITKSRLGLWLDFFKLSDNPFDLFEADLEYDILPSVYVDREYLDNIFGNPRNPQPTILLSKKGYGKTATREMVAYNCLNSSGDRSCLPVRHVNYENIIKKSPELTKITPEDHVGAILRSAFVELVSLSPSIDLGVLSEFDRGLLIGYAEKYADPVTTLRLKHLRDIKGIALDWDNLTASELLSSFAHLVTSIKNPGTNSYFQSLYILIDRVDESSAGDQVGLQLLKPLVSNGPLLNLNKIGIKLFLAEVTGKRVFEIMSTSVDRIIHEEIIWDKESLQEIVNLRLSFYSRGWVANLEELCAFNIKHHIFNSLLDVSDYSPRTLLRLCRLLIIEHCKRNDASSNLLERIDFINAVARLQEESELTKKDITTQNIRTQEDGLFLDDNAIIWLDGEQLDISLPSLEFNLFEILYKVSPKKLSDADLIRYLWKPMGEDEEIRSYTKKKRNNLRKLVDRLRSDLASATDGDKFRFIKNQRSVGYWVSKK